MRINSMAQVSQIYNVSSTTKTRKTDKASKQDELELSSTGLDYQVAKKAIQNSSDVRQEKVDDLKQRIDSGEYDVSNEDFAQLLIDRFNETI